MNIRGTFVENMALTLLSQKTVVFCRTFKGISSSKPILSLNSRCGFLLQTASYNARRLWLNFKDPYIPDKDSEKTPSWQKTVDFDRKLYARYGSASGIDPTCLWPTHEELDEIIAEENEWHPPLEVMLKNIETRENELKAKRLAREKLIAENLAKMPQMVEEWRKARKEAKQKLKEAKEHKARVMEEASERLAHSAHPRSLKFLEMVAQIEKEERKKKKLLKKQLKEQAAAVAPPTPPAAPS